MGGGVTVAMPRSTAGQRLRKARERRGLHLDTAAVRASDTIGANMGISRETLRKYEVGIIPEAEWNPAVIAALAELYGVSVESLSRVAAPEAARARDLLNRVLGSVTSRYRDSHPDQGRRAG